MTVSASTCGSNYDTVLLLGQEQSQQQLEQEQIPREDSGLQRLEDMLANDDDPACGSASRMDKDLQPGVAYYFVVSGFNGAAGDFALSVRCTSCGNDNGGRVSEASH